GENISSSHIGYPFTTGSAIKVMKISVRGFRKDCYCAVQSKITFEESRSWHEELFLVSTLNVTAGGLGRCATVGSLKTAKARDSGMPQHGKKLRRRPTQRLKNGLAHTSLGRLSPLS